MTALVLAPAADLPPIFGRSSELGLLETIIDTAAGGASHAALIRGEPGMGRSTLLRAGAARHGFAVLFTACRPSDRHRPFGILRDALDASAPGTDRTRCQQVKERLVGLWSDRPAVLAIDDAHWADDDSLALLSELFVPPRLDARLAMLLTCRNHELPACLTALLSRLQRQGVLSELLLEPLAPDAVQALAKSVCGQVPGPLLAAELHDVGGNPLHLIDVARSHPGHQPVSNGTHPTHRGAGEPASSGGATMLEGLSTDAWSVLSVAALLEPEFSVRELTEIVQRPMTELLPVLREAIESDVIGDVGDGQLGFLSPITRTAIGAALPHSVRAELHREIAAAMERSGAPTRLVAGQLLHGNVQPADLEWVTRLAAALLEVDPRVAIALWLRLGSTMSDGDPQRGDVDAGLVAAYLAHGDLRAAEVTARHRLARGSPPGPTASLHVGLATALMRQGRYGAALAAAESASAAAEMLPHERAEQLAIAATAALHAGDPGLATEAVHRAERAPVASVTPRVMARILAARGRVAHVQASLSEAEVLLRRASALIEENAGCCCDGVTAAGWHAEALADLDRLDEALSTLDRLEHQQSSRHSPSDQRAVLLVRAGIQIESGSLAAAVRSYDAALASGQAAAHPPGPVVLGHRALAALHLGGPAAAKPWLEELRGSWPAPAAPYGAAWPYRAVAHARAAVGDAEGEWQALDDGWRCCAGSGSTIDLITLGPHLAAAAVRRGDIERADAVCEALHDIAERNGAAVTLRAAALTAGGLASGSADDLMTALRLWQKSPRRLEAARVSEHVARALCDLGSRPLGGMVAAEAVRGFVEAGAAYDARRVRKAHSRTGARNPPRQSRKPTTGWDALTPTERVVAAVVERGESNAEIAQQLGLSRRTVESHVSHILAKLEMRSRRQLIVAAARRPVTLSAGEELAPGH